MELLPDRKLGGPLTYLPWVPSILNILAASSLDQYVFTYIPYPKVSDGDSDPKYSSWIIDNARVITILDINTLGEANAFVLKGGNDDATAKEVGDRLRREYHDRALDMVKGDEAALKFRTARYE